VRFEVRTAANMRIAVIYPDNKDILKHLYSTRINGVTSQKAVIFTLADT